MCVRAARVSAEGRRCVCVLRSLNQIMGAYGRSERDTYAHTCRHTHMYYAYTVQNTLHTVNTEMVLCITSSETLGLRSKSNSFLTLHLAIGASTTYSG